MRRRITDAFTVSAAIIALSTVAFLPGTAAAAGGSAVMAVQGQTPPTTGPAQSTVPGMATTPGTPSPPAGPADSGTGETRESKETRVDYAPYVVGAVVLAAVAGAVLLRRRRSNKTIV